MRICGQEPGKKIIKKIFAISKVLAGSAFTMFFREKVLMAETEI